MKDFSKIYPVPATDESHTKRFPADDGNVQLETCDFLTFFRGRNRKRVPHRWICCTWAPPIPVGLSNASEGDLVRALRAEFGPNAIGILARGKVWTTEAVFWQNQLIDRLTYPVVYKKPWFFQTKLKRQDKADCVIWDSASKRANPEPPNSAKVKVIVGPSRFANEFHLLSGKGTNWGCELEILALASGESGPGGKHGLACDNTLKPLPYDFPLSSDPAFYPPGRIPFALCDVEGDEILLYQ